MKNPLYGKFDEMIDALLAPVGSKRKLTRKERRALKKAAKKAAKKRRRMAS